MKIIGSMATREARIARARKAAKASIGRRPSRKGVTIGVMSASIQDIPLRRMRVARGLSQSALGSAMGIHQAFISRQENMLVKHPCSPALATRFLEFFGALWCGPEKELLFLYPDRYRGHPLPFEYVQNQPKP